MKPNHFVLVAICFCLSTLHGQELLKETKLDSISVFFESGSFVIKNSPVVLARINGADKQGSGRIVLVGYTDSVGSIDANKLLASKRLRSVKKLLQNSPVKEYLLDNLNLNEKRDKRLVDESLFRRVDILIYKLEPNYILGKSINLKIQFQVASDYVEADSFETMNKLLYVMKLDPLLTIKLNGHVCCTADQPMSLNRAKRVKSFLVQHGVDGKRISCFGYSNNVKLVEEVSPETQAINRRVEVIFLKD